MRILMLGWEFAPFMTGGLGRACKYIVDELVGLGQDIDFVAPEGLPQTTRPGLRFHSTSHNDTRARCKDLNLDTLSSRSILSPYFVNTEKQNRLDPYSGNLGAAIERYTELVVEGFKHHSCDVIHAHDWLTFPAGQLLARKLGVPLVAHFHSLEFDRNLHSPHSIIAGIEQMATENADLVVAVSRFTQQRLSRYYGLEESKCRVIYNGTDSFGRAPQPSTSLEERPTILFVGRLTGQKGVQYLCPIAHEVLKTVPSARFLIAGTGDMEDELKSRIQAEGLEQAFELLGSVEGDRISEVYSRAQVMVMPSVTEPFGLVASEAVEHGVPVVLSQDSGVSEILPHAFRADPADPVMFAQLISLLLSHQEVRSAMASQLSEDASIHTWNRTATELASAYAQLVPS